MVIFIRKILMILIFMHLLPFDVIDTCLGLFLHLSLISLTSHPSKSLSFLHYSLRLFFAPDGVCTNDNNNNNNSNNNIPSHSGWSVENVTTEKVTVSGGQSTVRCSSSHLTSFAVLVDVRGVRVNITISMKIFCC